MQHCSWLWIRNGGSRFRIHNPHIAVLCHSINSTEHYFYEIRIARGDNKTRQRLQQFPHFSIRPRVVAGTGCRRDGWGQEIKYWFLLFWESPFAGPRSCQAQCSAFRRQNVIWASPILSAPWLAIAGNGGKQPWRSQPGRGGRFMQCWGELIILVRPPSLSCVLNGLKNKLKTNNKLTNN